MNREGRKTKNGRKEKEGRREMRKCRMRNKERLSNAISQEKGRLRRRKAKEDMRK